MHAWPHLDAQADFLCCLQHSPVLGPVILPRRGLHLPPPDVDHNAPHTQALKSLKASTHRLQERMPQQTHPQRWIGAEQPPMLRTMEDGGECFQQGVPRLLTTQTASQDIRSAMLPGWQLKLL